MRAINYSCLLMILVLFCVPAWAEDNATSSALNPSDQLILETTLKTLDSYSSTVEQKKMELDVAKLNLEIEKVRREQLKLNSQGSAPATTQKGPVVNVGMAPAKAIPTGSLPIVSSLYGVEGKLSAELIYSDGNIFRAREGDELPEGFVVKRITDARVVIEKESKSYVLKFAPPSDDDEEDKKNGS